MQKCLQVLDEKAYLVKPECETIHNFIYTFQANINMRITPTYYHHDIFNQQPLRPCDVRYTPTYYSTVFDGQLQYVPEKAEKRQVKNSTVVIANHTMQQKLAFLNPQYSFGGHQTTPLKDEKDEMYHQINQLGGRTSRMRKCLQQMSNPIFNGCQWKVEISPQHNRTAQQHSYNSNRYCSPKKNQINQPNQQIIEEQLIKQKSTELVKEAQPAMKISQSKKPKMNASKDKQKSKLNRFKSQKHAK